MPERLTPQLDQSPPIIGDNVFVLVSHGSHEIPDYQRRADLVSGGKGAGKLSDHFLQPDSLVPLDASDYAVARIGQYVMNLNPDAASTPPRAGRMFINPNASRAINAKPRQKAFGEEAPIPIWAALPRDRVQRRMVQEIWDTYHDRVQAGVEMMALEDESYEHKLVVDVHDTDTIVLDKYGNWVDQPLDDEGHTFPLLLVSDRDGKAAHPVVRQTLGNNLLANLVRAGVISAEKAFAEGVSENFIYKGGYTTERYGLELPNAYLLRGNEEVQELAQHLHFVQIELNRGMYLTADRSGIDETAMAATQWAVAESLAQTSDQIRNQEFGQWREAPKVGSAAYRAAMNLPILAATDPYYRATKSIKR